MIDTARVNARAVAVAQDTGVEPPANRFFAFAIVRALVTPHIQRRVTMPGVQRFVRVSAECYLCKCFFYLVFKKLIAYFILLCSPVYWIRISFLCGPGAKTLVFTVSDVVLIFFINHVLYLFCILFYIFLLF